MDWRKVGFTEILLFDDWLDLESRISRYFEHNLFLLISLTAIYSVVDFDLSGVFFFDSLGVTLFDKDMFNFDCNFGGAVLCWNGWDELIFLSGWILVFAFDFRARTWLLEKELDMFNFDCNFCEAVLCWDECDKLIFLFGWIFPFGCDFGALTFLEGTWLLEEELSLSDELLSMRLSDELLLSSLDEHSSSLEEHIAFVT